MDCLCIMEDNRLDTLDLGSVLFYGSLLLLGILCFLFSDIGFRPRRNDKIVEPDVVKRCPCDGKTYKENRYGCVWKALDENLCPRRYDIT